MRADGILGLRYAPSRSRSAAELEVPILGVIRVYGRQIPRNAGNDRPGTLFSLRKWLLMR